MILQMNKRSGCAAGFKLNEAKCSQKNTRTLTAAERRGHFSHYDTDVKVY